MFKKYLVFPSKLKDQFICDTKKIKTNFSLVFNKKLSSNLFFLKSEMIIIHLEVLVSMISKHVQKALD